MKRLLKQGFWNCVKCKCRTWGSPVQCRIALLRQELPPSHKATEDKFTGILRTLRFTSLVFASKKKSTDSKPYGLPSVALAKDGGVWMLKTNSL